MLQKILNQLLPYKCTVCSTRLSYNKLFCDICINFFIKPLNPCLQCGKELADSNLISCHACDTYSAISVCNVLFRKNQHLSRILNELHLLNKLYLLDACVNMLFKEFKLGLARKNLAVASFPGEKQDQDEATLSYTLAKLLATKLDCAFIGKVGSRQAIKSTKFDLILIPIIGLNTLKTRQLNKMLQATAVDIHLWSVYR